MSLAPAATRFHIRKQPLQIADLAGHVLYLADGLLDLRKLFRHPFETLIQPLFQRRLKLFVDRLPHLLKLRLVAGADFLKVGSDRFAQLLLLFAQPLGKIAKPGSNTVSETIKPGPELRSKSAQLLGVCLRTFLYLVEGR